MKYTINIGGNVKTIDSDKFNANANRIAEKYPDAQISLDGGKSMRLREYMGKRGSVAPATTTAPKVKAFPK